MRFFLMIGLLGSIFSNLAVAQETYETPGKALPNYAKKIDLNRTGSIPIFPTSVSKPLPNIMITGYWPPTNEMLRQFSTDPVQNPNGWVGGNWENRGYNIFSFFPEFPSGLGKGEGDFEVDYQDTEKDFAFYADLLKPVAIITFGRAQKNFKWELEWRHKNLSVWGNDYYLPFQPTVSPPDTTAPQNYYRYSSLPMKAIMDAVNNAAIGVNAVIDDTKGGGTFLCEYIGYHACWYHDLNSFLGAPDPNLAAGHIHVGYDMTLADAITATEITLRTLIEHMTKPLLPQKYVAHENTVENINFTLRASATQGNWNYLLLGSVSGASPGFVLNPGNVHVPLNWDTFTDLLIKLTNTPVCSNFIGVLDPLGEAQAVFNTVAPIPSGSAGTTMTFTFIASHPTSGAWYASNGVDVRIVP